ncbi:NLI interacting factor-like phosphatase-domain-containing protein [Gorgonomyces haynaldii]|nr:NLI interacting factor-like phosphatase-domain-containing protein [Gorgonomyces haynaldii]
MISIRVQIALIHNACDSYTLHLGKIASEHFISSREPLKLTTLFITPEDTQNEWILYGHETTSIVIAQHAFKSKGTITLRTERVQGYLTLEQVSFPLQPLFPGSFEGFLLETPSNDVTLYSHVSYHTNEWYSLAIEALMRQLRSRIHSQVQTHPVHLCDLDPALSVLDSHLGPGDLYQSRILDSLQSELYRLEQMNQDLTLKLVFRQTTIGDKHYCQTLHQEDLPVPLKHNFQLKTLRHATMERQDQFLDYLSNAFRSLGHHQLDHELKFYIYKFQTNMNDMKTIASSIVTLEASERMVGRVLDGIQDELLSLKSFFQKLVDLGVENHGQMLYITQIQKSTILMKKLVISGHPHRHTISIPKLQVWLKCLFSRCQFLLDSLVKLPTEQWHGHEFMILGLLLQQIELHLQLMQSKDWHLFASYLEQVGFLCVLYGPFPSTQKLRNLEVVLESDTEFAIDINPNGILIRIPHPVEAPVKFRVWIIECPTNELDHMQVSLIRHWTRCHQSWLRTDARYIYLSTHLERLETVRERSDFIQFANELQFAMFDNSWCLGVLMKHTPGLTEIEMHEMEDLAIFDILVNDPTEKQTLMKQWRQSLTFKEPQRREDEYTTDTDTEHELRRRRSRISRPISQSRPKKTLVLDLDETLVHSTSQGYKRHDFTVEVMVDKHVCLYYISEWYKVVIFTASMAEYADPVIDWLDKSRTLISKRYFRESCTSCRGSYRKDLSIRMGFQLIRG